MRCLSASDDTALSVTMENPDSLYLRGFVGSVYDGSSWESLDTEDAYKQRTLFYWLHQDGFYGETQLSRARALADDDTLSDKVSEVDIKMKRQTAVISIPLMRSQNCLSDTGKRHRLLTVC